MTQNIGQSKVSWSSNGEDFRYDTLDELLSCEGTPAGNVVYVGDVCDIEPGELADADDIIQTMQERAHDRAGEYAEGYAENVAEEAIVELNAFLAKWIAKHASPHFFTVDNIREYVVTEEDVKDAM